MSGRAAPWIAVVALLGLVVLSIFLAASLEQVKLTEGSAFDETIGNAPPAWAYALHSGELSPASHDRLHPGVRAARAHRPVRPCLHHNARFTRTSGIADAARFG